MFRSRSTLDTAARSDARHQAEIISWWRDWHRWLRAQLQLMEARQAEATSPPSFERTAGAWEQQQAEAEQTLRRIPHDRRAVFEQTRERVRSETEAQGEATTRADGGSAPPRDPDAVERDTLTHLLGQAEGTSDGTERWGAVPLLTGWYELEVDALLRAPAAAEYAIAPDEGDERRRRVGLIAGLLLVGCLTVWWTWPRGAAIAAPSQPPELMVNGLAVERWPIRAVTVIGAAEERTTLPASAADPAVFGVRPEEQQARWSTTMLRPLHLCLPAAMLADAQALALHGGTDVPTRHYTLQPGPGRQPDLLVQACGTDGPSSLRSGMLVETTELPDRSLGAPITVTPDEPPLTLQAIDVLGPGQDPGMPDDKYRVVARVKAPAGIDWAALAPRLVLRTGLVLLPSTSAATEAASDIVEVSYLAPAWSSPMEAAWSITLPETQAEMRWRVTLAAPPGRAEVLRDALELTITGTEGTEPGSVTVRIALRNTSATSLVLTDADLVFTQADRTIPVTAVGTAGLTIAPSEARTLQVALRDVDPAREISVRIGAAGFRLRFEDGGAAGIEP